MICVSSGFRNSLLFLALFLASQTLAKPGNSANSTPVSSTATKQCNNAYYNFYHNTGTNKKTETLLQEIKKQLTYVEDSINLYTLKGNKTLPKKPNKTIEIILQEMTNYLTRMQNDINILKANNTLANEQNKNVEALLREMKKDLNTLKGNNCGNKTTVETKKNCAELYKSGQTISSVYTIDPDGLGAFDVFCDQTTAGGGWTVFQKRLDGSVNFYRGWTNYKNGFGNLTGEFWLGLDKIHRLTNAKKNRLRVDLEDTTGKTAFAEYNMFAVASERTKYQLSLGSYSGTAGDSLSWHRGRSFTTKDQDNDSWFSNCAVKFKGAWWYKNCHYSNLNGLYRHGKHSSYADGVNWYHWKGHHYSVKGAEMKIRPVNF